MPPPHIPSCFNFTLYYVWKFSSWWTSMCQQCWCSSTRHTTSVTRLRGKRGKLNYNRFFPEPTHNFLDHSSNQEVGPRGRTISATCALPHETVRFRTLQLEPVKADQWRQQPYCSLSHALWLMTSWKELKWLKVTISKQKCSHVFQEVYILRKVLETKL